MAATMVKAAVAPARMNPEQRIALANATPQPALAMLPTALQAMTLPQGPVVGAGEGSQCLLG